MLAGTEVDILDDGRLDFPDELLKKMDVVIASVHKKFKLGKKQMTDRIINAMSNDNVDIIGHLTGRMVGQREAYELEFDRIFKAAKDTKTVLEIDSQPVRLDLNGSLVKEAKGYGVRFSVDTDAHSVAQLGFMELGVAMARRGWCEKKDVVNTFSLKDLLKHLK